MGTYSMWFKITRTFLKLDFTLVCCRLLCGYEPTKCTVICGLKVIQQFYPPAMLHLFLSLNHVYPQIGCI